MVMEPTSTPTTELTTERSLAAGLAARRLERAAERSQRASPLKVDYTPASADTRPPQPDDVAPTAAASARQAVARQGSRLSRVTLIEASFRDPDDSDDVMVAEDLIDDTSDLCIFCYAKRREVRLVPCGHAVSCRSCTLQLIKPESRKLLCPLRCVDTIAAVEVLPTVAANEAAAAATAAGATDAPAAVLPRHISRQPTFKPPNAAASVNIDQFLSSLLADADAELAANAKQSLENWVTRGGGARGRLPTFAEAVRSGDEASARASLEGGVLESAFNSSVQLRAYLGQQLHVSAWRGFGGIVALLVQHGAPVDHPRERPADRVTPLWTAAARGHAAVVRELLGARASLSTMQAGSGCTALSIACQEGCEEAARLLVEAGAALDERCGGLTPLHVACEGGHAKLVELLLDGGADLEAEVRCLRTRPRLQRAAPEIHSPQLSAPFRARVCRCLRARPTSARVRRRCSSPLSVGTCRS